MKAIVISETYNRFERTKQVLSSVNITEVIHSPAIFVPNTPNCSGINGHRLAFRNAWNTIKVTNTPMLILEDDVVIDIRTHIPRHMNTDLHYFGWCGSGYWCNHATYTSVRATSTLLRLTTNCLDDRVQGIDFIMSTLCGHSRWKGIAPMHHRNHMYNITCSREKKIIFKQNTSIGVYHRNARQRGKITAAVPLTSQTEERRV